MPTAAKDNTVQCRPKMLLLVASVLSAVIAAAVFWLYQSFHPSWRVRVSAINIPVGTDFASFVAESDGILSNMEWSPKSEIHLPFTMDPASCIWSIQNPDNPKVDWNAYVRWQPGERYGVVTRNTSGTWRVTWFEAGAVPIRGRLLVLGGGEVAFDLSLGQTELMPADQVRSLGLQDVGSWD